MNTWHFQKELYNERREPFVNETRELTHQEAHILFTQEVGNAIADGYVINNIDHYSSYDGTDESFFIDLYKYDCPNLLIWVSNCWDVGY